MVVAALLLGLGGLLAATKVVEVRRRRRNERAGASHDDIEVADAGRGAATDPGSWRSGETAAWSLGALGDGGAGVG